MAEPGGAQAWRAHAREQLLAWLRLTPRQRLDWLWQAKGFAERVRKAAAERGLPGCLSGAKESRGQW
ncbi:MAG: hypothetical protein JXP73_03640 [Deltaproteobacteria bacterium]|nr:hypothetical protein [Deltaproteobacteria bacterium]